MCTACCNIPVSAQTSIAILSITWSQSALQSWTQHSGAALHLQLSRGSQICSRLPVQILVHRCSVATTPKSLPQSMYKATL